MGDKFSYLQAREPAYVFEIWCFMEFANALIENGLRDVVQCSLLRAGDNAPIFQIADGLDVFYNFFGDRVKVTRRPKAFLRTHVDWFIMNRPEPRKSIIVDTKYRDWASDESLKVLGYMTDFDVDRAVIIYRGTVPKDAIKTDQPNDRFVVCRFADASQKLFCAMSLRPTEEDLEENSRVLKRLIDEVVLAGG